MTLRRSSIETSTASHDFLESLAPEIRRVSGHQIYARVTTLPQLRIFMESHVFAVWDFMNLLLSLRSELVPCGPPWIPMQNPEVRRFINEIQLEEESDDHPLGGYTSHLELYLDAMAEIGADTGPVDRLLRWVGEGQDVIKSVKSCGVSVEVADFVGTTWQLTTSPYPESRAAAFAIGRETAIPRMFAQVVDQVDRIEQATLMSSYLHRHIELDGGAHGQMALRLLDALCGEDPRRWARANESARVALRSRTRLWDAIAAELDPNDRSLRLDACGTQEEIDRHASNGRATSESARSRERQGGAR